MVVQNSAQFTMSSFFVYPLHSIYKLCKQGCEQVYVRGGGANTSLRRIAIPDLYLELGDPLGKGIILGKRTRFQLHQLVHLVVSLTFIFLFQLFIFRVLSLGKRKLFDHTKFSKLNFYLIPWYRKNVLFFLINWDFLIKILQKLKILAQKTLD